MKKKQVLTREQEERFLTEIPILGYFFRKIKDNREAIEMALNTGKKTLGKVKRKRFLLGLFGYKSQTTYQPLNLGKKTKNE